MRYFTSKTSDSTDLTETTNKIFDIKVFADHAHTWNSKSFVFNIQRAKFSFKIYISNGSINLNEILEIENRHVT